MAEITIHRASLKINREMPGNSLSMNVEAGDGIQFQFFFRDLEQWWAIRNALPKSDEYVLIHDGTDDIRSIRDHCAADAWARDFYARKKANLLAVDSEPVDEVATMLQEAGQ